ncbi:MAG: UxaA family hydrolase [Verrucomicrobiae bacterium]|nr:UxaA family hydrolase [Verrucomicrobiae bacterium]
MLKQRAYVVHPDDNVATALDDLTAGPISLLGETLTDCLGVQSAIKLGHKIALKNFKTGEPVIKFGVKIGETHKICKAGDWVHLHNMKSCYDHRSNEFDPDSGATREKDVYR